MRTLYRASCYLFLLLLPLAAWGQNSADCFTAIPVCADTPYAGLADGGGADDFDPNVITQTGCLEKGSTSNANIENNASWYVFRASQDGMIGFDIEALSTTADWDFALYGPDVECTDISNGTAQPIRCNYETNVTGYTGLGTNPISGQGGAPNVTGSQNSYDEMIQVTAGEVYYLFINNYNTNFNGDPEPYELTFTGPLADADPATALDCTIRDEFLGLNDIVRCEEGDPDVVLTASNSPAGPNVVSYTWTRDIEDDGTIDEVLPTGPNASELTVTSPNSGRYFVSIETTGGTIISDDILITWYGLPQLNPINGVEVLDDYQSGNLDTYNIQINVLGNGDYEYALNGGEFQDDPVFLDVPAGLNNVAINDKNGCGTITQEVYVLGYPRFFTPDGTGPAETERWNLRGIDPSMPFSYTVFIFDRYGKLLKQMDETSQGWDGIYNGKPLPSSDYWFRVQFNRDNNGVVIATTSKSHFSLRR